MGEITLIALDLEYVNILIYLYWKFVIYEVLSIVKWER